MTDNLGPGVSRVLQADATQYTQTIWQQSRPPLDSELNFQQVLAVDLVRNATLRGVPSGFLGDALNPHLDYVTNPAWSNHFRFGAQKDGVLAPVLWAHVNGYLIPVAGTKTRTGYSPGVARDDDYSNVIVLDAPPSSAGETRVDFVFLEVWRARLQPTLVNGRPSLSGIWRYGNVDSGFSALSDEMLDPGVGFETTQRVQLQYRIRVARNFTGLGSYPDGFDDTVLAQGAAGTPQAGFAFANMRKELGDPGLWRAGNGQDNALGTVDGYVYAVPIAAVFRRNSVGWVAGANLSGSLDRNQSATSARRFVATVKLAADITADAATLPLSTVTDLPFPLSTPGTVTLQIGDEQLTYRTLTISATTSGTPTVTLVPAPGTANVRGTNGTIAEPHKANTLVRVLAGRPDGLFADQVAATDILDLRHVVSPNGFDYRSLLEANLDRLLRGELRANWKRAAPGGGLGPVLQYQDVVSNTPVPQTTKLDRPDNIRMVFSDAATVQSVEVLVLPSSSPSAAPPTWSPTVAVRMGALATAGVFTAGDVILIDGAQLRSGATDMVDQVRWLADGVSGEVTLRYEGETSAIPSDYYKSEITSAGDLKITLGNTSSQFPVRLSPSGGPASVAMLRVKAHVVYGPARGLARRPDTLHAVTLSSQPGVKLPVLWAPLWSRYRSAALLNRLPATAQVYADPGSKTVIVSPLRQITFPSLNTLDGVGSNLYPWNASSGSYTPKLTGSVSLNASSLSFTAGSSGSAAVTGDALVIASGPGAGRYAITVTGSGASTAYTLDRAIALPGPTTVNYSVYSAFGLMPTKKRDGVTNKWNGTSADPLGLFCGPNAPSPATNLCVRMPRHMVPGWGELYAPVVPPGSLASGVSFMIDASTSNPTESQQAYAAFFSPGATQMLSSVFSHVTMANAALDYNTAAANQRNGASWAGLRFYADTRGLGRKGLELPPFYGIAKLKGVYQASDYIAQGSSAVNLMRQAMEPQDGPSLWIEIDDDLDSTFIINANLIDLSKAATPIASFEAGTYVVEAVVFGFDRGAFDLNSECRILLTRPGNTRGWSQVGVTAGSGGATVSAQATRSLLVNRGVFGPAAILPGPAQQSESVSINYSRTPYQGDAWGSQSSSNLDSASSFGPISLDAAYTISTTNLNLATLTRPNQKPLEVLTAVSFSTTLGTGRYSGDASTNAVDFRDVAYEDLSSSVFPPPTASSARPAIKAGNFVAGDAIAVGSTYLGCTERLPMGAYFRDASLRGQAFNASSSGLVYSESVGVGALSGASASRATEMGGLGVETASASYGSPGEILVHVDGVADGNVTLLTNYRVHRGGSVFTASGPNPGGPVIVSSAAPTPQSSHVSVMHGRAMLVRNTVTNVGSTERSAGDELMLLILTSIQPTAASGTLAIGTNGTGEGYAAADLYRISGHPLVRNHARLPDPTGIPLPPKV